ncbi:MAG: DUF2442 domain-containing protein [Planctomycetes bacterium]|nr:DUF2442 domain-containing protein [Planctomycetota bacterium]
MTSSGPDADPRAVDVVVDETEVTVRLGDGRRVSAPLAWFPRLAAAGAEQLSHWRLVGDGRGIHWPELDEDLSVLGLLRGTSAPGTGRHVI